MNENIIELANFYILIISVILNAIVLLLSKKKDSNIQISRGRTANIFYRLISYWIDVIIVLTIVVLIRMLFSFLGINLEIRQLTIPVIVLLWLYFAGFESTRLKATPIRFLCGIQVVDLKGQQISFIRSSARYIFAFLSDITFSLGNALVFLTKYNQSLHDVVTSTLVVDRKLIQGDGDAL